MSEHNNPPVTSEHLVAAIASIKKLTDAKSTEPSFKVSLQQLSDRIAESLE